MRYDDVVVGAGHNGLTAAAYLARAGRRVLVLEASDHVGGAAVSAQAFPGVDARLSRYSYLVSLLPRQVISDLELDVQLVRRRFSSYTPVPSDPSRGLLVDNGDPAATAASFRRITGSDAEYQQWQRFYERMGSLARQVLPTVLEPLRAAPELAAMVGDDELWDALTRRPLGALLESTFRDDTVRGVVATDALIGTFADLHQTDLRQNICFLYHLIGGGTGDWDVPVGGMGAVTGALARAATNGGAVIRTGAEVTAVEPASGVVSWEGGEVRAERILAGCAPAVLGRLLAATGADLVPTESPPEGAQLKVNMLLTRLPRLRDVTVDPAAAFSGTFHIHEGYAQLQDSYAVSADVRLPHLPPCEVYCHTLSDRSILGPKAPPNLQTLTLFGLHMPARIFRGDNERMRAAALRATMASLSSVLAEPIEDLLAIDPQGRPCLEVCTPLDLERDVRLPGGNIFHRSLQWPWAERPDEVGTWGVETPYERLLVCGAGARRGGGVSGIPGHNAAQAVIDRD